MRGEMAIDKEAFAIIGDQLAVIELLATDLELVKAALPAEMRDGYQYVAKKTQAFSPALSAIRALRKRIKQVLDEGEES